MLASYQAVGIFEEWDLSMQLFNANVKSSVRNWNGTLVLNQGYMDPERRRLLEWAYMSPDLNAVLRADILLYEFALSIFKHQTFVALGTLWK